MKISQIFVVISLLLLTSKTLFGCVNQENKQKDEAEVSQPVNDIVIDSKMTFEEAIKGTKAPKELIDNLRLVDVEYIGFDHKLHRGQLVVHKEAEQDIKDIFKIILEEKFPVNKVIPIVKYNWSDDASMADDNTSAFNYRNIAGTNRLSNHSFGRAIDINPFENPAVYKDGSISPKGARYSDKNKGTLTRTSNIYKAFLEKGWRWGGDWSSFKDYQHFDKPNEE